MNQENPSKTFQRRNYYIDSSFQKNFIIKFCLIVILGSAVSMGTMYALSMNSTTVAMQNSRVVAQSTAESLIPLMLPVILIVMGAVAVATIFVTMLVSHKIAGPLYRFRQTLKDLESGNFAGQIRLREKDQLQNLANDMNGMIIRIRSDLERMKQYTANIQENVQGGDKKKLSQIEEDAQKLQETLQRFRT